MIGIIGYGFVGKAVEYGFRNQNCFISDPKYNDVTIKDLCSLNLKVIFVCVPTPIEDENFNILKNVLDELKVNNCKTLVVVKSTVLFNHLEEYDVVYNPEFLSRNTAFEDFVNPPFLLIGGDKNKSQTLLEIYQKYSEVKSEDFFLTDIKTASIVKYTINSFAAMKVTFMNEIFNLCEKININYSELINILSIHPFIGKNHLMVPGPDGLKGFGGPCLPKDTFKFSNNFNLELLKKVLELNERHRR